MYSVHRYCAVQNVMSLEFQNTYVLLNMLTSSTGDSGIYVNIHDTKQTKCTNLFLIHLNYNITLKNISTSFGLQETIIIIIIMESNQSNTIP